MGTIIDFLLSDEEDTTTVLEASVHRSAHSRVWQAVFTGPGGGQVWRSTGLTNRQQALLVARRWEAQARAERQRRWRTARKPLVRAGEQPVGLTQREIALVMKLSERAVRQIERRAVRKLLAHPELRQAWQDYLSGQLEEDEGVLTPEEVEALLSLVRTPEEKFVIQKVLRLMQV